MKEKGPFSFQSARTSRKMGNILMLIGVSIFIICGLTWILTILNNRLPQASLVIGLFGYILLWGMGFIFLGICVRYTAD
ncbi:MAG: hypothetical protein ACXADB_07620 [Candidatus Hermodarchaeia archaeon]